MGDNVVRFSDYEGRSQNQDACAPRDPADACQIIILPVIRIERIRIERTPPKRRRVAAKRKRS